MPQNAETGKNYVSDREGEKIRHMLGAEPVIIKFLDTLAMYHNDHNCIMLLNCTSWRREKMTITDNLKQWMWKI